MQVAPRRTGEWRISPAIPALANLTLAALWLFTTLGGWGEQAFCGAVGVADQGCVDGVHNAVLVSLAAVIPSVGIILVALLLFRPRRDPDRLSGMLTAAAILWVFAEGVVFLGGHLAQTA
ncbi:hypothetical protein [Spirillospora sp. NPDC048819]|uniref:hypothetical protein n=1 Tax=Spirillospora sp. NPDC048819 TaxID=3155268 RepID=UPI0033D1CAAF